MKTLTKSILALVAVLSISLFVAGCGPKSADWQGYSAPGAGTGMSGDNFSSMGAGNSDPSRGAGISDNDTHNAGVFGPTNEARGTESHEN
ncbi:hypothetical protein JWG42_14990 [Desulfoprunum benzoelyticum]|jgi:hypothetical protein|uniref:Lipoprotein n=1 Tax=Desulfoprunum benzoelyticum TaxID=1506996 RepID=A0A840V939_9BACT|nr:hypothetical protein [Desulfoprunum benzoelyticum]MBB5349451.1 hypothetical protein [Desulfoprunum benzoelyticum]MBM9531464.1 hypothetical protein [Desulfoprunum benzoelyticum]